MNKEFVKSYRTGGIVPPNRYVKFGTEDYTVVVATAATDAIVGVSDDLGAGSGEVCDVIRGGIAKVKFGGSVTRGDLTTSDGTGQAVAAAPAATATVRTGGIADVSAVNGDEGDVSLSFGALSNAANA